MARARWESRKKENPGPLFFYKKTDGSVKKEDGDWFRKKTYKKGVERTRCA